MSHTIMVAFCYIVSDLCPFEYFYAIFVNTNLVHLIKCLEFKWVGSLDHIGKSLHAMTVSILILKERGTWIPSALALV